MDTNAPTQNIKSIDVEVIGKHSNTERGGELVLHRLIYFISFTK